MRNNKGQSLGLAILTSIVFLILGLMFVNFLTPEISDFRSNLDCTNAANISDGTKLTCLLVDTTVVYWIVIVFSVVIGGITSRLLL